MCTWLVEWSCDEFLTVKLTCEMIHLLGRVFVCVGGRVCVRYLTRLSSLGDITWLVYHDWSGIVWSLYVSKQVKIILSSEALSNICPWSEVDRYWSLFVCYYVPQNVPPCVARDITIDRDTSTIFQLNIGLYCNQVRCKTQSGVRSPCVYLEAARFLRLWFRCSHPHALCYRVRKGPNLSVAPRSFPPPPLHRVPLCGA